jgi:uncharacterized membrane protein
MNRATKRSLFWAPRILCILTAAFLSIFALDVFGEGRGFWETALALVMHLIPVFLVVLVLVIAWRWEWVGAVLFCALGLLYIVLFWGRFPWFTYAAISGPLFAVGILFLINWRFRSELRAR